MKPTWRFWVFALFAILLGIYLIAHATKAKAHDWYSSRSDPVFDSSCCGGSDCAPLDSSWVTSEKGGFRLRMNLEQTRTVNPLASKPVDAFIPMERVQSPPKAEAEYYACIYEHDRDAPRKGVICFFATPLM